jgi:hypothetical protein
MTKKTTCPDCGKQHRFLIKRDVSAGPRERCAECWVGVDELAPQRPHAERLGAARRNARAFGTHPSWFGIDESEL